MQQEWKFMCVLQRNVEDDKNKGADREREKEKSDRDMWRRKKAVYRENTEIKNGVKVTHLISMHDPHNSEIFEIFKIQKL